MSLANLDRVRDNTTAALHLSPNRFNWLDSFGNYLFFRLAPDTWIENLKKSMLIKSWEVLQASACGKERTQPDKCSPIINKERHDQQRPMSQWGSSGLSAMQSSLRFAVVDTSHLLNLCGRGAYRPKWHLSLNQCGEFSCFSISSFPSCAPSEIHLPATSSWGKPCRPAAAGPLGVLGVRSATCKA